MERLIKLSAEQGATELQYGDLFIRFGKPKAEAPPSVTAIPEGNPKVAQELESLAVEKAELEHKADQIAELLITDPLRAEEMMRDGDLEEAEGGPDTDDGD